MEKYIFTIKGLETEQDMEDLIGEINYCEFCNNDAFTLYLKDFSYDADNDIGTGLVEFHFNEDIDEKIEEILYCEFCHTEEEMTITKY